MGGTLVELAPVAFAFAGAALVTWLTTPLVARLAVRLGAVDLPGGRRIHARPTPRLGGVAITLGLLVGATTYGLVFGWGALVVNLSRGELLAFLLPCLIVFLVGLVDDLRGLSPTTRLAAEALAASFLVQGGYVIDNVANPFGAPIDLGLFALPITVAWVVGVTNAYNLIDGLDGLLGTVSVFALIGCAAVALLGDRGASALLAGALAGAVFGFLLWNWHPARIFMGDSGSLLVGFAIAALSVKVARNSSGTLAFHVPLLLSALPIAETLLTLARRHINGHPYFSGDRSHIHHVLLNKGLTVRHAVAALGGIAALLTVTAVLSRNWRDQAFLAGCIGVFSAALAGLLWLGYLEFRVLGARLVQGLHTRREELARAVTIAGAGDAIEAAPSLDALKQALRGATARCRLSQLAIHLSADVARALGEGQGPLMAASTSQERDSGDSEPAPEWVFTDPEHQECDEARGRLTLEVHLFDPVQGARLGRLICQREAAQGASEIELLEHLVRPLVRSLSRLLVTALVTPTRP